MAAMLRAQRIAHCGFTYLGLLFIIAIMSTSLALVGVVWHTAQKREKEKELLFVGNQYRQAIGQYFLATPGLAKQYPYRLEDLLKDARRLNTRRYLRRLYADPITGSSEWGLVKAADGGIMGVYSRSEDEPIKTSNFKGLDKDFEDKKSYADWWFIYTRPQAAGQPPPAVPAVPPAAPGQAAAPDADTKQAAKDPNQPASTEAKDKSDVACDIMRNNDTSTCSALGQRYGDETEAACSASADARYAQCLQKDGKPLPPLLTSTP
jgi:type II secretory pathway pseudopilin PulG